jgi:hypothetical protein
VLPPLLLAICDEKALQVTIELPPFHDVLKRLLKGQKRNACLFDKLARALPIVGAPLMSLVIIGSGLAVALILYAPISETLAFKQCDGQHRIAQETLEAAWFALDASLANVRPHRR